MKKSLFVFLMLSISSIYAQEKLCGVYSFANKPEQCPYQDKKLCGLEWTDVENLEELSQKVTSVHANFNSTFSKRLSGRTGVMIREDFLDLNNNGLIEDGIVDCILKNQTDEEKNKIANYCTNGKGKEKNYALGCSGVLFGENLFLTAGHCSPQKPVGVLFDYQYKERTGFIRIEYDLNKNPGEIFLNHPYLSVNLDELKKSPAYFETEYKTAVENGFNSLIDSSKSDYSIFQLKTKGPDFPSNAIDLWPWKASEGNNPCPSSLEGLCRIIDMFALGTENNNGNRGYTGLSTRELNNGEKVALIGHPGDIPKTINAGELLHYETREAFPLVNTERVMILKNIDMWPGSSGSGLYNVSGQLVGISIWTTCNVFDQDSEESKSQPARTIGTPVKRMCEYEKTHRTKDLIRKNAKDMDCNGINDWVDFITRPLLGSIGLNLFTDLFNGSFFSKYFTIPQSEKFAKMWHYNNETNKLAGRYFKIKPNTYQTLLGENGDVSLVVKEGSVYSMYAQNDIKLGNVYNYPALAGAESIKHNNTIFLAGGKIGANANQNLFKIEANGSNYSASVAASLPQLENIRLLSLTSGLYIVGNSGENLVVLKYANNSLSTINTSLSRRGVYNIYASGDSIYLAGGSSMTLEEMMEINPENIEETDLANERNYSDILRIRPSVSNEWEILVDNLQIDISNVVISLSDNILKITSTTIVDEEKHLTISVPLDVIPVPQEQITTKFESVEEEQKYCIGEDFDSVFGGIIDEEGNCIPFAQPEYSSFEINGGADIFSVAGKANILFIGGLDGIYTADITDPTAPVGLDHEALYGPVYDMIVSKNTLFAAVENGISILEIKDPVYMNTTRTIRYHQYTYGATTALAFYENSIIAADRDGITKFNLDNGLISENDPGELIIQSDSQVYDMKIDGNILFMVTENSFSAYNLSNNSMLSNQDITYAGCYFPNTPKIALSNESIYVGCENSIFKVNPNDYNIGTINLAGESSLLKDSYFYNGTVFTPESDFIKLSR